MGGLVMNCRLSLVLGIFLALSLPAQAAPAHKTRPADAVKASAKNAKAAEPEVKEITGMSIMGNNDAPKSLYIVPWKTSELGGETEFKSSLLEEDLVPVDKPVFQRELDFYAISNSSQ